MEPTASRRFPIRLRARDLVWVVLFGALAVYGRDLSPWALTFLLGLCVFQVLEPNLVFFSPARGAAVAFFVKLVLCYFLLGWTDGLSSNYFWFLLLPVVSAASSMGLWGTSLCIVLACAAYLSFYWRLPPGFYVDREGLQELAWRVIGFSMVAYLTNELAEAKRSAVQQYRDTAEKLTVANDSLRKAEAAAHRSERLAALGQMSAGLAHELRNPLGTMKTSAEMLMKSVPSDNELACEMARFISEEVDRTDSLITRFLDFAKPLAVRLEEADVARVIDRAVEQVERHRPPFEVTIYKNYSPDVGPFQLDPELMERVFYNLLLNAAQASPPRSSITVKTRRIGDTVEVAVIDRGSGIDRKHIENIFNPFFTTKQKGTGLGLAIVSKIVDQHGGKVTVESEPGSGTVFRVYLPAGEKRGEAKE